VKTDQLGDAPRAKNFQEDRQMMRSVLMKLCGVFEAELLVYYQHRKFVSSAYEKTGHFACREGISRDAGHLGRNTGCPGKYGTVGNPSAYRSCDVRYLFCYGLKNVKQVYCTGP